MGKKQSTEEIKQLVEDSGYKFHKIFSDGKHRIINITCPHGHNYDKRLDGFKKGERCCECVKRHSYSYVKEKIESEGYKLLSKTYVNENIPLEMKCPKGHSIQMRFSNFNQGKRCKYCSGNQKHLYSYVKEKIESEGYKLLSKTYVRESDPLKLECPKGHKFSASYGSFRSNHRCPKCSRSKGEEKIIDILTSNNIIFETQKSFPDCKHEKLLYFDFYIQNINACIEFDGRQHYEQVFSESLDLIKIRDNIKNKYCENNSIQLIRIPYWDINDIENILVDKKII